MNFRKFLLIFQASACLFLAACTGIKPVSVKGGSNLYETFYQGESTQYFLKPLHFYSASGKGNLEMDFTFRSSGKESDTAVIRFSILGKEVLKSLDSFTIQNGLTKVKFTAVEHMFSESKGNDYVNRFTAKLGVSGLTTLFTEPKWQVSGYKKGKTFVYKASRKTTKNIIRIQRRVMAVL